MEGNRSLQVSSTNSAARTLCPNQWRVIIRYPSVFLEVVSLTILSGNHDHTGDLHSKHMANDNWIQKKGSFMQRYVMCKCMLCQDNTTDRKSLDPSQLPTPPHNAMGHRDIRPQWWQPMTWYNQIWCQQLQPRPTSVTNRQLSGTSWTMANLDA